MPRQDQFRKLAEDAAQFRRDLFAVDANGEAQKGAMQDTPDKPFDCYRSSIKTLEQLEHANFRDLHDTFLRVAKTENNFKPVVGKKVILFNALGEDVDLVLEIKEIAPSGFNPEHVVGCKTAV